MGAVAIGPKRGLTPRQATVLAVIRDHIASNGHAPSYREIAAATGVRNPSAVSGMLDRLRQRGCVDWTPGRGRSLRLVTDDGLPATIAARLDRHCALTGDRPADVIADAVLLHLDELEAAR